MTEAGVQQQPLATVESPPAAPPVRDPSGFYSLQSIAGTIVIAIFVITFLVQAFQIPSESMEKTLLIGDYLLVDKAHYGHSSLWSWLLPYRPVQRQDIIVFRFPINPRQYFVKRVVAIPGDRVRLVDKHVYVNGVRQNDSYATFRPAWRDRFRDEFPDGGLDGDGDGNSAAWFKQARKLIDNGELIVPENSYFVLGDNRDNSEDSRYWGFVPRENVVGRPLMIYWSMDRDEFAMASAPASGKLASLTSDVAQWLSCMRWQRVLRVPR